jgi:glycosyltransferase involved in cell wall biosynthesis
MKVACISTSAVPSIAANSIQVMKVCQALAQTGNEVTLWIPGSASTPWAALSEQYGISTPFQMRWLNTRRALRRYDFAWAAVRQASDWGADILYTWTTQAAYLALRRKLPLLLEIHDLPTGRLGPWLFRQICQYPGKKRLLIITQALLDALQKNYAVQIPPEQVRITPNTVDMAQYNEMPSPEQARQTLNLPQKLTLAATGHLYAGRGVPLFLRLASLFPQAQFLWVGGRPGDVENWRQTASRDGLTNITFTGFIPNKQLPLYQAAADILLMPYEESIAGSSGGNSATICSPMKMFEYMASGRPIITSDLPVIHEILDETSAFFCPAQETSSWATAIQKLSDNPALRREMGENALRKITGYTWQTRAENALKGFLT